MSLAYLLILSLLPCAARGQTADPPSGRVFSPADLIPLIAKRVDEPAVRGLFLRLSQGEEPGAHVAATLS